MNPGTHHPQHVDCISTSSARLFDLPDLVDLMQAMLEMKDLLGYIDGGITMTMTQTFAIPSSTISTINM
jgi:hypothetical protein